MEGENGMGVAGKKWRGWGQNSVAFPAPSNVLDFTLMAGESG